jgi:hypothetical protein
MHRRSREERVDFFLAYRLRSNGEEPANREPEKCSELLWANLASLSCEISPADGAPDCATILKRSYLAIPVAQVAELMSGVGFQGVCRVDDRFFQPVLLGTRPVV